MKLPGPDHPITITPNPKRIRVTFNGAVVADSARALTLQEASYPAVQYIPREDADMALLARTERSTHCPYKGDASYYSIEAGGRNGVGPNLHGIIGRKAGIVEGFRYSANLKEKAEAGLAWDEATLRAYVTNPKALLPAGAMSYPGLKNEQSLNDLLAFLKTQG